MIVTRNDYALGVFNGDIGIALPAVNGAMQVCFRMADGTLRMLSPAALPPHDTAFALTVPKSQGSEFDHAALVLPSAFGRVLSRELVYTAITRARSRIDVIDIEDDRFGTGGLQMPYERPVHAGAIIGQRVRRGRVKILQVDHIISAKQLERVADQSRWRVAERVAVPTLPDQSIGPSSTS